MSTLFRSFPAETARVLRTGGWEVNPKATMATRRVGRRSAIVRSIGTWIALDLDGSAYGGCEDHPALAACVCTEVLAQAERAIPVVVASLASRCYRIPEPATAGGV